MNVNVYLCICFWVCNSICCTALLLPLIFVSRISFVVLLCYYVLSVFFQGLLIWLKLLSVFFVAYLPSVVLSCVTCFVSLLYLLVQKHVSNASLHSSFVISRWLWCNFDVMYDESSLFHNSTLNIRKVPV